MSRSVPSCAPGALLLALLVAGSSGCVFTRAAAPPAPREAAGPSGPVTMPRDTGIDEPPAAPVPSALPGVAVPTTGAAAAGDATGGGAVSHPVPVEPQGQPRLRTWEMPVVEVVGKPVSGLYEEERIGSYGQPRWTAHRRFPTTRVYVIPRGKMDAEYWMRVDTPRHGKSRVRHYYEFEWGFAERLQLDLYAVADHVGGFRPGEINQEMIELRYALADWGEIWGNPTLYFEFVNRHHAPESVEAKFLLGDELAEGWHWGSNLVWEQEIGGAREREVEWTAALSKTIVDDRFSVGGELKAASVSDKTKRSDPDYEFFLGPSFQYRFNERCHADFAPLVGLGNTAGELQTWFIVGWEF